MRKLILVLCAMLLMASAAFAEDRAAGEPTPFDDGFVTVEGYGLPPAMARSASQSRLMARRAAMVDAYRNLAEAVQGVQVDAETTVRDMMIESDLVRTKVSALVKGGQIVSQAYDSDGTCRVTMRAPMYGASSVASTVMPSAAAPEPFPQPSYAPAAGVGGGVTGLVVDCRGLGLQCVMSPVIRSESGEAIYGHRNLDSRVVISKGMAGYSRDGVSNLERAGASPLTVKAVRLEGHNANPVVSADDAARILAENARTGFLSDCAVVFIR